MTVDCFRYCGNNPWHIFPFLHVFFSFFQCLKVFSVQVFHLLVKFIPGILFLGTIVIMLSRAQALQSEVLHVPFY